MEVISLNKWLIAFWLISSTAHTFAEDVIEIDIHGMTCAFCVDAVQRNLSALPDVKGAEVSLELKKVRIHAVTHDIDMARIKDTIIDSGFTPVAVRRE